MSEIEKIERYIDRTPINPKARSMSFKECCALAKQAYETDDYPLDIILLAFKYGVARGCRMAKAERRRAAV